MLGTKPNRKNRYKAKGRIRSNGSIKNLYFPARVLKAGTGLLVLTMLSLCFIFVYDFITQCSYFKTREVTVSGEDRLSEDTVIKQAGIKADMNIMAFNLAVARKRLLVHPWIAEADVQRIIPAGIHIRIEEHRGVAVFDLGRKYLIDESGVIIIELSLSDTGNLPIIRGLRYADLKNSPAAEPYEGSQSGAAASEKRSTCLQQSRSIAYDAVVDVLSLGSSPESVLPNRQIKQIRVDREMGLTLYAFDRTKTIQLGFNDYASKYAMLKTILHFLNQGSVWNFQDIDWIDLKNLNRIVINPFRNKED